MLVLLMYGHSNMDGRSGGIDTFHPRTWRWEGGRQAWQRIDKDNSPAGPLLQRLAEAYPDYQFAAVKMAQSGGTIEGDFRQGRRAYKQLVDAGKAAQAFGHLAGVVTMIGWCEGGEGKTGHAAFGEDFAAMVSDLRKDLKAPDLPFVVSQVEVGNPPKNEQPEWQAVHAGIDQLPFRRQGVIVVPANRHFRDSHHYSEEGYLVWTKEAATRMAAAGVIEAAIDEQRSVTSMDARGDEVEYGVDEMLATVRGKVVLVSSPRTLEELGTYEHCLITTRYQVLDVRQGELPKGKSKHIVVIDYHIRDRKPQPAGKLKVGDTVTLELADWRAQRHLHSLAIDDDLEDLDSPQFFVLKMQR